MLIIKSDTVDMSTVLKDQTDQVKKLHHRPTKIERQRTLTLNAAKIFLEF